MHFTYDYLPKILILSLKRFEYRDISGINGGSGGGMGGLGAFGGGVGGMIHREKIDSFVDFPINGLNLKKYCGLQYTCSYRKSTSNGGKKNQKNQTARSLPLLLRVK